MSTEVLMDVSTQIDLFQEFFDSYFLEQILRISRSDREDLMIDFGLLSKFNIELSEKLLSHPEDSLKTVELALSKFDVDKKITPRFYNLPRSQDVKVREIRSRHIGKFVSVIGVIKQKSGVKPKVTGAKFECPSCGNIISITQEDNSFTQPSKCSCGRKGKFRLIDKELIDSQKIVVEESYDTLEGGSQPKRIPVFLTDELTSTWTDARINAGTNVEVIGMIKEIPITTRAGSQSTTFELIINANFITPLEDDFMEISVDDDELDEIKKLASDPEIYTKLRESIAPSIYGHELIKDSLVLQLFGGVRKQREDGAVTRGDTHILLIGDPGTGKCISGDTKVMLSDGTITTFEELTQSYYFDEDYVPISQGVMSFDLDCKSSIHNASKLWKRKCDAKMVFVRTASGRELKLTQNHPLFTTYGGFVYGEAVCKLKKGDFIAIPRKINLEGTVQFLPKDIARSSNKNTIELPEILDKSLSRLFAYIIAEGCVGYTKTKGTVRFCNNDLQLIDDFTKIITSYFKIPVNQKIRGKNNKNIMCTVNCRELASFLERIDPRILLKSGGKGVPKPIHRSPNHIVKEFLSTLFECDGYAGKKGEISYCSKSRDLVEEIQMLLLRFGVHSILKGKLKHATNTVNKTKRKYYELILYGENAQKFVNEINFMSERKREMVSTANSRNTNKDVVPGVSKILKVLRLQHKLTQFDFPVPRTTYQHYERGDRLPSRRNLAKISQMYMKISPHNVFVQALYNQSHSDIFWDKIEEIKEINSEEYVYDFEVQKTHNFVANGVMVHNSQLIKRISVVAPKAYYVSGKGASGAGLTATVLRDEHSGSWILEAGSLVLANKGYLMIDEMDKMNKEDRDAMHEGLEQQSISISKANIQATLRCQTTTLAAANPKFGRFDPYLTIAEQIDMPASLINRFDLIFPVKDLPDKERDKIMAGFILKLHQGKKENQPEVPIPTALLRKYIAYARQNCSPVLTDEAIEAILEEYVSIRNAGGDDGHKSVPISSRQLEGIIRLSEACAKIRLSAVVAVEDAKRAIDLVMHCLMEIAVDKETGRIDIDKISSGITASARSKIVTVKEIIVELEEKIGKIIPIDDIIKEAEQRGVTADKVEESIEKLKRSGDIFEPKVNFISRL